MQNSVCAKQSDLVPGEPGRAEKRLLTGWLTGKPLMLSLILTSWSIKIALGPLPWVRSCDLP